eukprot:symbB.v1.2.040106.t1/scaffold6996.1/size14003/1
MPKTSCGSEQQDTSRSFMDGFTRVAGPPIPRLSDLSSVVDPVSEAGGKPRRRSQSEVVQNMMEELGSIFRERLAALLSAPNATAAMAAAKGATEKPSLAANAT